MRTRRYTLTPPASRIWPATLRLTRGFRTDAPVVLLVIAIATVSWLPRLTGPIDLRWDGSVYYVLGTSLAEGKGYRLLNEPGEIEAIQYPPLLPLIVAAHQRLLGTSDFLVVGQWLRAFYFLIYVTFAVSIYWLVRLFLGSEYALIAACLSTLSLYSYIFSDMLYTELPFALVTVLFVLANKRSDKVRYAIVTPLLGMAAYFFRAIGFALLVAWVAESLLRRRFKQMIARTAIVLLSVFIWQSYVAGVTQSQEYRQPVYPYQRAAYQYSNVTYLNNTLLVNPFFPELGYVTVGEMLRRIGTNLIAIPIALGEVVSAPVGYWQLLVKHVEARTRPLLPISSPVIPLLVLACLVVSGVILLTAQLDWFVPLYLAASMGMICLAPWPEQSARYLTPLTPFLVLSLLYALIVFHRYCTKRCREPWNKTGLIFSVIVLTMILLVEAFSLAATYAGSRFPVTYHDGHRNEVVHNLFFYYPPWQELDMSLEWVRQRANAEDVIATTVPHWAYLRTRLKTVLPPMVADQKEAQGLFDSVPVKYVLIDDLDYPGLSRRYAAPVVHKYAGLWKLVYVAPQGRAQVYERLR